MTYFWFVIGLAIFTPFVIKAIFPHKVSISELATTVVITTLAFAMVWHYGRYQQMSDVEIINGSVTRTFSERYICGLQIGCRHSYSCRCRTDSNGNRTCDTCWEYPWEKNYYVDSNIGKWEIDRVDRQGSVSPPRWTSVSVGDPVSRRNSYVNYVKGVPESLFHMTSIDAYKDEIPNYPDRIYDYYKINRIVKVGDIDIDVSLLEDRLRQHLKVIGPEKQANIVIVLSNITDSEYFGAIRAAWIGGKKNDIISIIGLSENKIVSAEVFSWSKNDIINVTLRDKIVQHGSIDVSLIDTISMTIKDLYERQPMENFAYLADEIEPPVWMVILATILAIMTSAGLSYCFIKYEFTYRDLAIFILSVLARR